MRLKTVILAIAAVLPLALPAAAHFPPAPNTNCDPTQDPHDFVGASSATVTTGITGEFGGGVTIAFDGSVLPCGTEDFCEPGDDFIVIDPSGDDLPDGTDPSGDNIVIKCDDILVGTTQVPVGDSEFEFGLGGGFLPDTHHDPLTHGYYVDELELDGGFIFCSDADNDGDCEEGSGDCFESHDTAIGNATQPEFTTTCPSGGDNGWWFFAKCNATVFPDSDLVTNGALLRGFGDDDEDGIPNFAEDNDGDGIPNGAEDNDGDGAPDIINPNWNPQPSLGSPSPSVDCLAAGHVGTYELPEAPAPQADIVLCKKPGAAQRICSIAAGDLVDGLPAGWPCNKVVGGASSVANNGDAVPNSGDYVICAAPGALDLCLSTDLDIAGAVLGNLFGTVTGKVNCDGGAVSTCTVNAPGGACEAPGVGGPGDWPVKCESTWGNVNPTTDKWTIWCEVNHDHVTHGPA